MKGEKVFVIGFQKTGTTSIETALKVLGYKVYGGDKNLMKFKKKEDLRKYIFNIMQNWDAVQDMPWPLFYKELYELYPNAKFILTYREPDKWIKSIVEYFASIRIPLHQKIYNVPCAEGYEDTYLKVYNENNNEIIGFFKDKDNFLKMSLGEDFNYSRLCNFLEIKEIPNKEFPRSRTNKQKLAKNKLYRKLRSIYWNYKKKY